MKVETIAVKYEKRYIADNGQMWQTQEECKQYEELLNDLTPLQELRFFDCHENPIDIFQLKEIPDFCYLVLLQDIKKYYPSVIKRILGVNKYNDTSYQLPRKKGVWYNNWTNAYNGGYGSNGWEEVPSIEELEKEIKYRKEKIKKIKKMVNNS